MRIPVVKDETKSQNIDRNSKSGTLQGSLTSRGMYTQVPSFGGTMPKTSRSPTSAKTVRSKKGHISTKSNADSSSKIIDDPTPTKAVNKYELMLKQVNNEFQQSLKKNSELTLEISDLEVKLHHSNCELDQLKANKTAENNHLEFIEQERMELQKMNQDLSRTIIQKNEEIDGLKKCEFELETKLVTTDSASAKLSQTEAQLRGKIEELISKYGSLDDQIRDRERELHTAHNTIDVLKNDLRNYENYNRKYEQEIRELKNDREKFYEMESSLKEKIFKSATALKQIMSENDDLKREKNITESNYEFSKNIVEQLKNENSSHINDFRRKAQKYQLENSELRQQFSDQS